MIFGTNGSDMQIVAGCGGKVAGWHLETFNPRVVGSIPTAPTNKLDDLDGIRNPVTREPTPQLHPLTQPRNARTRDGLRLNRKGDTS